MIFLSYLLKSLDIWQASMLLSLAKEWNFLVYIYEQGCSLTFSGFRQNSSSLHHPWFGNHVTDPHVDTISPGHVKPELPWVPGHGLPLIHSLTVAFISLSFPLHLRLVLPSFKLSKCNFTKILLLVFLTLEFLRIWN